ncbi:hypothetical protein K469DRAFT_565605, partial [Zopfia rhizophila CBS 207.26]
IFFTFKVNSIIKLYINYYSLNYIIVKNYYLLLLTGFVLKRKINKRLYLKLAINILNTLLYFLLLKKLLNYTYIIYFNNILIYSKDKNNYKRYIYKV